MVMARKVQQTRKLPMYPEKMVRLSGSPRTLTLIQIGKVRPRAMSQTVAAARNFPSLLQIVLYQRLGMAAGDVYTAITLTRYFIVHVHRLIDPDEDSHADD